MQTKLGLNIANYRKKNKITQEEFASRIASSKCESVKRDYSKSVSKWELGDNYPEVGALILIAEELGITIDDLVKDQISDFGISPAMAIAIEELEDWDLDCLVRLYQKAYLLVQNGEETLFSYISLQIYKDGSGAFWMNPFYTGANRRDGTENDKFDIEYSNDEMRERLEDLMNSPFLISYTPLSSSGNDDSFLATVVLLNDMNIAKAIVDESAKRMKKNFESKYNRIREFIKINNKENQ